MEQTVARTKEEIWYLAMSGMSPLNDIKAAAFPAMDEYAKQQAIEFAKWIKNKGITGELIITEDIWFEDNGEGIGDTNDLYAMFLQSKNAETQPQ